MNKTKLLWISSFRVYFVLNQLNWNFRKNHCPSQDQFSLRTMPSKECLQIEFPVTISQVKIQINSHAQSQRALFAVLLTFKQCSSDNPQLRYNFHTFVCLWLKRYNFFPVATLLFFCAAPSPPRPVRKRNGKTTSCSFRRESFHFVCTLKSFQISARNFSHVALLYFCQGEGGDGEKCATDLKWLVAGIWRRRRRRQKKDSRTISSAVSSLKFNCINFNRENLLTDHAQEQSWGCVCVGVSMCEQQTEKNLKYL